MGGSRRLWRDRLEHWARNPALPESAARGWVARDDSREIVGFMANAPFDYASDDGDRFVGMAAHTLVVRPSARGKGVGRSLTHAEFLEPCDFSVGVQTSVGGWAATLSGGGNALDQDWMRKSRVIVAHPASFARRLAVRSRRALPDEIEEPDEVTREDGLHRLIRFDPSDDSDLSRMIARSARVRPLRDALRLNWLYFGSRHLRQTRLVLGLRRGKRLSGYAGFRILPDSLVLLECRTLPDAPDALPVLLDAGRAWAREQRLSHLLVYDYSAEVAAALRRFPSLLSIGSRRFPYAIAVKNAALRVEDLELGPWDGDAIFADDSAHFI